MNPIDPIDSIDFNFKLGQKEELKILRAGLQKQLEDLRASIEVSKIKPLVGCYLSSARHVNGSSFLRIRARKGYSCPNGKPTQYIRESDVATICARIDMARDIENTELAVKLVDDAIKKFERIEGVANKKLKAINRAVAPRKKRATLRSILNNLKI